MSSLSIYTYLSLKYTRLSASDLERAGWQSVPVHEVGPGVGLPAVACTYGVLHLPALQDDGVALHGDLVCRVVDAVLAGHLEGAQGVAVGGSHAVGMAEGEDDAVALGLGTLDGGP